MKKPASASVVVTIIAVSCYGLLKLSGVDTYLAAFVMFMMSLLAGVGYKYLWRRDTFPADVWKFLPLIGLCLASLSQVLLYPVYAGALLVCAGFAAYFVFLVRYRVEPQDSGE